MAHKKSVKAATSLPGRKRESKRLEFKEKFNPEQPQDWCELIKDIIAIANSGGGNILIGIKNNGTPSGENLDRFFAVDPAQITDKISKYTGQQFSDFEIQALKIKSFHLALIKINGTPIPIVFVNPGTYPEPLTGHQQKTAFGRGTLYFRHGAKSEPANHSDLRESFENELICQKKSWNQNIRKVIAAPVGSQINITPGNLAVPGSRNATPMRLVEDPSAPSFHLTTPDDTHPHRLKDAVMLVNKAMGGHSKITPYDIQCVRRVHGINHTRPDYFFKSKFSSPQYSEQFISWLMQECERSHDFFKQARNAVKEAEKIKEKVSALRLGSSSK